jgi:hypothetical protein
MSSKVILIFLSLLPFTVDLFCQNSWFTLKSSDFVIGLSNNNFLRERLYQSQLRPVDDGVINLTPNLDREVWQSGAALTIEIEAYSGNNPYNIITVQVFNYSVGIPDKVLNGIEQVFPIRQNEVDIDSAYIQGELVYKKLKYTRSYTRANDDIGVTFYYDNGVFYFIFYDQYSRFK